MLHLNPRMTVGDIIGEGIDIHKLYRQRKKEKINESFTISWT